MVTVIKNGLVYENNSQSFEALDIVCENGIITSLSDTEASTPDGAYTIDASGMYVFSGLVDVHTHGRAGYDFLNADMSALEAMACDYARRGVTTVMPTLASAPYEEMMEAAERINLFKPSAKGAELCGVHIEGRYLNSKRAGAHAPELLSALDPCELEHSAIRNAKRLHISGAYELDGGFAFCKRALELGATLGLGHTDASYGQAIEAEKHGVSAYTHLFNAMPPLHHRDGGAVCAALLTDAYAELICDGIHVAPEMVALAYKAKGAKRLSLISDSMEATGCEDGEYSIAGNPVRVSGGIARTPQGALAGSTLTLDEAVRNLMRFANIPITKAIVCATEAPARQMGMYDVCGSVDTGKKADLVLCTPDDTKFDIRRVILRGELIS